MHILPVFLLLFTLMGCSDCDYGSNADTSRGMVRYNVKDDSYTSFLPKNDVNICGETVIVNVPENNTGFVQYSVKDDSYTSFHPTNAFGDSPPPTTMEDYLEYEDEEFIMKNDPSPDFTMAVLSFMSQFVKNHNLKLENSIMCRDKKGIISGIRLEFTSQELLEMCPARKFIVDLVEDFLGVVNCTSALTAKFKKPPATANDLDIYINFESFQSFYVNQMLMGEIALQHGMLYFYTHEHQNYTLSSWKCRMEPYDKALEIVTAQRAIEAQEAKTTMPLKNLLRGTSIQLDQQKTQGGFQTVPQGFQQFPVVQPILPQPVPVQPIQPVNPILVPPVNNTILTPPAPQPALTPTPTLSPTPQAPATPTLQPITPPVQPTAPVIQTPVSPIIQPPAPQPQTINPIQPIGPPPANPSVPAQTPLNSSGVRP